MAVQILRAGEKVAAGEGRKKVTVITVLSGRFDAQIKLIKQDENAEKAQQGGREEKEEEKDYVNVRKRPNNSFDCLFISYLRIMWD